MRRVIQQPEHLFVFTADYMYNGSAANVGNIDIKVSTTVVARISAGNSQTLMGVYTVPAGYTAI